MNKKVTKISKKSLDDRLYLAGRAVLDGRMSVVTAICVYSTSISEISLFRQYLMRIIGDVFC